MNTHLKNVKLILKGQPAQPLDGMSVRGNQIRRAAPCLFACKAPNDVCGVTMRSNPALGHTSDRGDACPQDVYFARHAEPGHAACEPGPAQDQAEAPRPPLRCDFMSESWALAVASVMETHSVVLLLHCAESHPMLLLSTQRENRACLTLKGHSRWMMCCTLMALET